MAFDKRGPNYLVGGLVFGSLIAAVVFTVIVIAAVDPNTSLTDNNSSPSASVATTTMPDWACDVDCVKSAARLQGADVLTSLDNMKYSMEVVFSDTNSDAGEACGMQRKFPPFSVTLDPSLPVAMNTQHTRKEPDITFQCQAGKTYHMVLNDALGGKFQATQAYTHWLKLNLQCPSSGLAVVKGNGRDMAQGTMAIPGWYKGTGYLYPAFPYNALHHFNFYIFEASENFNSTYLDTIDKEFPAKNPLGGASLTVKGIMDWLGFQAPVARTWMDVTTSYWSHLRMGRLAAVYPPLMDQDFYKLICPCNHFDNWPGIGQAGNASCNL